MILTLERNGPDAVTRPDRRWAAALRAMCDEAGVARCGVFLSSDSGVRPLT